MSTKAKQRLQRAIIGGKRTLKAAPSLTDSVLTSMASAGLIAAIDVLNASASIDEAKRALQQHVTDIHEPEFLTTPIPA